MGNEDRDAWIGHIESECDRITLLIYHECIKHTKNPTRVSINELVVFKAKVTGIITFLMDVLAEMSGPMKGEDRAFMVESVIDSLSFIQEELDVAKITNNNKLN